MCSLLLLEAARFGEGVPAVLALEKGFRPSLKVAPLPASTSRELAAASGRKLELVYTVTSGCQCG